MCMVWHAKWVCDVGNITYEDTHCVHGLTYEVSLWCRKYYIWWYTQCAWLTFKVSLWCHKHYSDVIINANVSHITGVSNVYSTVCSGAGQRNEQISASLAFMRGIQRWQMNYPRKGPVTRKMFPFNDGHHEYIYIAYIHLFWLFHEVQDRHNNAHSFSYFTQLYIAYFTQLYIVQTAQKWIEWNFSKCRKAHLKDLFKKHKGNLQKNGNF